jgi:uncharacterized repeat protein (TIGR03803 family)
MRTQMLTCIPLSAGTPSFQPDRCPKWIGLGKFGASRSICAVFLLCAASVIASSAQTFTTLVNFDGTNGFDPYAPLVQGTDGNFYGTTSEGGAFCSPFGCGTVFKMTAEGKLTTLHRFDGNDGDFVFGGLVQATDGHFYGTTFQGGSNDNCDGGCGTIYKIGRGGKITTLYNFCSQPNCIDGSNPFAALVQGSDGNFYGTTCYLVSRSPGTVFKITPGGTLTTLYTFCSEPGCADGYCPGGLIQGRDGDLYGTTAFNGAKGYGTVFKITSEGTLTTLHNFNYYDGFAPSSVIQGRDGNFYGTTSQGGPFGEGEIFKMTPAGSVRVLYSFFCSQTECPHGSGPVGALVQATDGNFYGTTYDGGVYGINYGTVFKLTRGGKLMTLHSFDGTDGTNPSAGLVQAADGAFYGTTSGGAFLGGTIFRLDAGLDASPSPAR